MMIKQKLKQILNSDGRERSRLIEEFQQSVWSDKELGPEIRDVLLTLAYDLNFYESNSKTRSEDASYYGDGRLHEEIITALERLESYGDI